MYTPFDKPVQTWAINMGWGFLAFIVLYINIIRVPLWFPAWFELSEWTVLKHMLFSLYLFLIIGVLFTVVNKLVFCGPMDLLSVFLKTQKEVTLTGILPLVLITVLAKNELLKQNLADAVAVNKKLSEINALTNHIRPSEHKITLSTDTSETFTLTLADFIYAVAIDNYTELFWKDESKVSVKLLRATLKNIESQFPNQYILRCHRSFIVNIREINSISGNTNGYRLHLKHTDTIIPVSRGKGKEIITHIQQIRDLMDVMG
jgi:hypothetical protein